MEIQYSKQTLVNPTYNDVHTAFKLNGFSLDREDLCRIAYIFIKEGEDYERAVGHFLLDWFDANSYIEMQTSGTTGTPKIIRVEKQAMVNSALATGRFFELAAGNRVLHCLPAKYVAGKMMFVRGFILGLDMDFVAPVANPLKNTEGIYDFAALVPLQAQQTMEDLHRVKKVIIGGAKIGKKLEHALLELPAESYETYGMTETITHIAAKKVGEEAFTVLPGVTVSYNEKSCLVIHAPHINPEVVITNDVVQLISENQFVFLGRADNVINTGGIKVLPEMVEDKISGKLDRRVIIAGVPDETLGQKVVLLVEGDPFEVDNSIFDALDKYEKPKQIYFVPKFAETGNGKILRADTVATLTAAS
jgi:O-succinylbenzoic acid--CoA ligase